MALCCTRAEGHVLLRCAHFKRALNAGGRRFRVDFWRTISILSKRKWLITLSVLITAGLTLAASRMVGSKWVATARFAAMDTARLSQMANGQQETSEGGQGMEPFEAQAAVYGSIVASREVIEPALRDQGILYDPEDIIDSIEFEATAPRM